MQRAMVALVPQVTDRVMVLLVMPTRWFVCLSARGVGVGVGRLPVRVVVAMGVGAPGAWRSWLGAGACVGVYLVRVAGGLWAAGALLPCVWRFVLSGGAWLTCSLHGWCGVWSAWVVSVWVFGVGCWLWACRPRGVVGRDGGAAGDVDGDGAAGDKGGTAMLAVSGVGAVGGVASKCTHNRGTTPHQPTTHGLGATTRPSVNPDPQRRQPARINRHQKVTTGTAKVVGPGQPQPPLTQDLSKPAGATAEAAKPEPNPTGQASRPSLYITHPTHGAGARLAANCSTNSHPLATPNADQCVHQPKEGRGRNR